MKKRFTLVFFVLFAVSSAQALQANWPRQITNTNRKHPTMFGGWGPHLRSIMKASNGSLWYSDDSASSVNDNDAIRYFMLETNAEGIQVWTQKATNPFGPYFTGVQQNTAHLMIGSTIVSYGIDIEKHQLMECYIATTNLSSKACNTVWVSGNPLTIPSSSNYVGAALTPSGHKVVWWTTVGSGGTAGSWSYIYDSGSGWTGPVVTSLTWNGNNYDFLGYVRIAFESDSIAQILGESAQSGGFFSLGAKLVLGSQLQSFFFPGGLFGNDIYYHAGSQTYHALVYNMSSSPVRVDYFYKTSSGSWSYLQSFSSAFRARFLADEATNSLKLVLGGASLVKGLRFSSVSLSSITNYVDWNAIGFSHLPVPSAGFGSPAAIYAQGNTYQTSPVSGHIGVVGDSNSASDHEVWHFEFP